MTRTRVVMRYLFTTAALDDSGRAAVFTPLDHDDLYDAATSLPLQKWDDMGRPEHVIVTVEPHTRLGGLEPGRRTAHPFKCRHLGHSPLSHVPWIWRKMVGR